MSNIGYFPRIFALTHLPHKKINGIWQRTNGDYELNIHGEIPYGPLARLLILFIITEAIRNKSSSIFLGKNISELLLKLNLKKDGRYISRLKEQIYRLFQMKFLFKYKNNPCSLISITNNSFFEFPLTINLTSEFYFEATSKVIPISISTIFDLKQSSMAIDIYIWLTHRMSYLSKPTTIKFSTLSVQFGASFKRQIDFKINFLHHLQAVLNIYKVDIAYNSDSIMLCPGITHIYSSIQ